MFDGMLIAIPPPATVDERGLCEACRAAAGGGATAIQLRLKRATASELMQRFEAVSGCVQVPVYVNDRADVAVAAGAAGVHLGADDLPLERIREVVPHPMKLGVSVGAAEEAGRAIAAEADYWSFGPFFHTSAKPDAGPPIGADGFRFLRAQAPSTMPCLAIGGVTFEGLEEIVQAGAAGVAVISAIFSAADVELATKQIRRRLDALLGFH